MTSAVYRKIHLVPFGEFVPLADWLTFFPPLVQTLAGFAPFTPGDSMIMLPIGRHRASTAICYEVVYPSLVREAVTGGSELLTTITNDAWYGHSSAPFQHFAMAAMRAIEHGRYMARAANTGISGVVDPYGRVVAQSAIFEQVGLVVGRCVFSPAAPCIRQSGDLSPRSQWRSSCSRSCSSPSGLAVAVAGWPVVRLQAEGSRHSGSRSRRSRTTAPGAEPPGRRTAEASLTAHASTIS